MCICAARHDHDREQLSRAPLLCVCRRIKAKLGERLPGLAFTFQDGQGNLIDLLTSKWQLGTPVAECQPCVAAHRLPRSPLAAAELRLLLAQLSHARLGAEAAPAQLSPPLEPGVFEDAASHLAGDAEPPTRVAGQNVRAEWTAPVVRFDNGREEVILPALFRNEIIARGLANRAQLPLKAAWAITIHKSQGMTLATASMDVTDTNCVGQARPAYPSPSPYLVPGLPHVMLVELRQALISYQD